MLKKTINNRRYGMKVKTGVKGGEMWATPLPTVEEEKQEQTSQLQATNQFYATEPGVQISAAWSGNVRNVLLTV